MIMRSSSFESPKSYLYSHNLRNSKVALLRCVIPILYHKLQKCPVFLQATVNEQIILFFIVRHFFRRSPSKLGFFGFHTFFDKRLGKNVLDHISCKWSWMMHWHDNLLMIYLFFVSWVSDSKLSSVFQYLYNRGLLKDGNFEDNLMNDTRQDGFAYPTHIIIFHCFLRLGFHTTQISGFQGVFI